MRDFRGLLKLSGYYLGDDPLKLSTTVNGTPGDMPGISFKPRRSGGKLTGFATSFLPRLAIRQSVFGSHPGVFYIRRF